MKKVVATLDYGMLLSTPIIILLWVGLVCSVTALPGLIAAYVSENDTFWLYFISFPLLSGLIFLYVIVHNRVHKKLVQKWLVDSVELPAITKVIYEPKLDKVSNVLKVTFSYQGENKVFYSRRKINDKSDSFFCNTKFVLNYVKMVQYWGRKSIKILFSPSYNKVLLCKA